MPVRIIITLLIIAMLCNGLVLAADVHSFSQDQHYAHTIGDHVQDPEDSDAETLYDHCYHMALHLLGLNSIVTLHLSTGSSLSHPQYSFSLNSFSPPLPLRPPIPA